MNELGTEAVVKQVVPKAIEQRNNAILSDKVEKGNFSDAVREKLRGIKKQSGRLAQVAALAVFLAACDLPLINKADATPTTTPDKTPTTLVSPTSTKEPTATTIPTRTPTVAPTPTERPTATPTVKPTERPKVTELPKDIVSREELKEKWQTEIYDLPDLKLHIRQRALTTEEVFKHIQVDPELRLKFLLFDGPLIQSKYMTPEQIKAFPLVYKALQSDEKEEYERQKAFVTQHKESSLRLYQRDVDQYKQDLADGRLTQNEYTQLIDILKETYGPKIMDDPQPDDFDLSTAAGKYMPVPLMENGERKFGLFFLTAARPRPSKKYKIGPYEGTVTGKGSPLSEDQSFPNPNLYEITNNPVYPVNAGTVPWVIRHEVAHGIPVNHPQTDWSALLKLQDAYKMYQKGDDSGYYFVFEDLKNNIIVVSDSPAYDAREFKPLAMFKPKENSEDNDIIIAAA